MRIILLNIKFLIFWWLLAHLYGESFLNNSLIGIVRSKNLGMNGTIYVMIPSTFWSSVMFVGFGSDLILLAFLRSECTSFLL